MSDDDSSKPSILRLKIIIILIIFLISVYMGMIWGLFNQPEEPEEVGIIVRFILFFKQNMLI